MKIENYTIPAITGEIPHGDMPGDVVKIGEEHIKKGTTIFPLLVDEINALKQDKVVVSVFGGSGVGKSETASVLGYFLNANGIRTYIMSGDNYPRRIPLYNDAERASVFRSSGLKALVEAGEYSQDVRAQLDELWAKETDSDPKMVAEYPFLATYQKGGRAALKEYLGTMKEQDYDQVNGIIDAFKKGASSIYFKRMGRTEDARYYEAIDTAEVDVLIIEWTHGGNEHLSGVDIPVLLNSTPEETKKHRLSRARDGKIDSAFTTMVLEIEQEELDSRRPYAKIVLSKQGEILDR